MCRLNNHMSNHKHIYFYSNGDVISGIDSFYSLLTEYTLTVHSLFWHRYDAESFYVW